MFEKIIIYIAESELFNLYVNSSVSKNWFTIMLILSLLFIILDLTFNKPDSRILAFFRMIEQLDLKSKFIYEKEELKWLEK